MAVHTGLQIVTRTPIVSHAQRTPPPPLTSSSTQYNDIVIDWEGNLKTQHHQTGSIFQLIKPGNRDLPLNFKTKPG